MQPPTANQAPEHFPTRATKRTARMQAYMHTLSQAPLALDLTQNQILNVYALVYIVERHSCS